MNQYNTLWSIYHYLYLMNYILFFHSFIHSMINLFSQQANHIASHKPHHNTHIYWERIELLSIFAIFYLAIIESFSPLEYDSNCCHICNTFATLHCHFILLYSVWFKSKWNPIISDRWVFFLLFHSILFSLSLYLDSILFNSIKYVLFLYHKYVYNYYYYY